MLATDLVSILERHTAQFHPVIRLQQNDKIASLDLSSSNAAFTPSVYSDTDKLSAFIEEQKEKAGVTCLVGGYKEKREMYRRSELFDKSLSGEKYASEEPRSLHLGIDIWGAAGTKVYPPLGGMVHSFAYNNHFGDYGATIILQHQLETINFYTLYGHLALKDIEGLRAGRFFTRGEHFAHFGEPAENGNWPPHLHFQVIIDMLHYEGDYPGVCKMSEAAKYLHNSPDPTPMLKFG